MARSDEAAAFFHAVYSAVQEIPRGKVTSYAHIATLVGTRTSPRPPLPPPCTLAKSPGIRTDTRDRGGGGSTTAQTGGHVHEAPVERCVAPLQQRQRPVAAGHQFQGRHIAAPDGAQNQAAALRDEGVHVTRGAMGEFMVDFGEYGWFPRVLPSEAVGDEAWESSTGEEEEGE
ncbi:hypothetical protein MHUMG1_03626 [Metarhizium humberi]|uniref:Methylated-DNA-[protein]-cysteine S-methyltransferase DNA binding domain-containing protein n=1 Tax=Metarhizium humberi TaxID=2596975 RepID=A0A9P8MFI2_9HYPO|nr:hypothetical protein MHUMG1_03626 [Metarhizium humberi]